jgi:hypothetical protein
MSVQFSRACTKAVEALSIETTAQSQEVASKTCFPSQVDY